MKTIGTNGRIHIINPERESREIDDENISELHKKARALLKECLPYSKIYEEVTLLGCRGPGGDLRADFLIPEHPIIVEVHGEQHYKFSKFYHKTKEEFDLYLQKDKIKKEWAELNSIIYIELPYYSLKEWKKIINGHLVK